MVTYNMLWKNHKWNIWRAASHERRSRSSLRASLYFINTCILTGTYSIPITFGNQFHPYHGGQIYVGIISVSHRWCLNSPTFIHLYDTWWRYTPSIFSCIFYSSCLSKYIFSKFIPIVHAALHPLHKYVC